MVTQYEPFRSFLEGRSGPHPHHRKPTPQNLPHRPGLELTGHRRPDARSHVLCSPCKYLAISIPALSRLSLAKSKGVASSPSFENGSSPFSTSSFTILRSAHIAASCKAVVFAPSIRMGRTPASISNTAKSYPSLLAAATVKMSTPSHVIVPPCGSRNILFNPSVSASLTAPINRHSTTSSQPESATERRSKTAKLLISLPPHIL